MAVARMTHRAATQQAELELINVVFSCKKTVCIREIPVPARKAGWFFGRSGS
jgi:hypothetical protein